MKLDQIMKLFEKILFGNAIHKANKIKVTLFPYKNCLPFSCILIEENVALLF